MHPSCAQQHLEALGEPFIPPVGAALGCAVAGRLLTDRTMLQVCKHHVRRGACLYGPDCFYRHPPLDSVEAMPK